MLEPQPEAATGFGHGKVILLGEHAVVYGYPAVAAGMSAGVTARALAGRGQLRVPAWSLALALSDEQKPSAAVRAIFASLGGRAAALAALDIEVEATVPAAAGLGSSAAFATAVARALAGHLSTPPAGVANAVAIAEGIFHGNPSGIDAAAAATGGVGLFTRAEGWRPVALRQPITLCVGLSGRPRDTAAMVTAVAALHRRTPAAAHLIEWLGALAQAGTAALAVGDIDELGRLFDLAHGGLSGLRVSSPELDALVHGARAAGAVGAKLTGAGGGGAVIALAPGHEDDVLKRWRRDGFSGFVTRIERD